MDKYIVYFGFYIFETMDRENLSKDYQYQTIQLARAY